MLLKQTALLLFGFCAGGVIAAGVFAFLVIIGVFPRLIGKSHTSSHIVCYETVIILGGVLGNVVDIFEFPMTLGLTGSVGTLLSQFLLGLFGLFSGVFVGCLVMSLAETVKALPVINRRIGLAVGFQYVIVAVALGKLIGALIYFLTGMGA